MDRNRIQLELTGQLTFVDPKGVIPSCVREKARAVAREMVLPSVVIFARARSRETDSRWSGTAFTQRYEKPASWLYFGGCHYVPSESAMMCSVHVGRGCGPVTRDCYDAWIGSVSGNATVLSVIVHELAHLEAAFGGFRRGEVATSKYAMRLCRQSFPTLFAQPTEFMDRTARTRDAATAGLSRDGNGEEVRIYVRRVGAGNQSIQLRAHNTSVQEVGRLVRKALAARC